MDVSVSVPPPSCSEGVCPPKQKTKTLCVFEVLGPVPPPLTGIHTQNAVNEFAGLCCTLGILEQLAQPQAAPHKDAPGGMSQRLPEQPQNGSDEPNIPGISFHPNLSWSWPWLATHLLDLARGGLHRPPAKIANRPPGCALATMF